MKTEFVSWMEVEDYEEACRRMFWAAYVIEVEGGCRGFETEDDYETWRQQQ